MKRKTLVILIVATIFTSTVAFAQKTDPKQQGPNRGEMMMRKDLQPDVERTPFFTEEQQEAIKKIRLETEKEVKPLQNKLNEMEAKQHTLTTAEKADLNAIYKNIDEMAKVKTEIAKIHAKSHQDVRSLLTDEQLVKFDKMNGNRLDSEKSRPGMNQMNRAKR